MHSPELAQKTLETTQLTAGHPEIKGMAAKFVKELAEDTQGKTINLYTPKIHKKVMNFYDKIYTKAGVTGDPALSKIFNRAGSYRPYKVGPIKDN